MRNQLIIITETATYLIKEIPWQGTTHGIEVFFFFVRFVVFAGKFSSMFAATLCIYTDREREREIKVT